MGALASGVLANECISQWVYQLMVYQLMGLNFKGVAKWRVGGTNPDITPPPPSKVQHPNAQWGLRMGCVSRIIFYFMLPNHPDSARETY